MNPREFAKVREINAKLPFAHPIEQGEETTLRDAYESDGYWYPDHPAITGIPELNPLNADTLKRIGSSPTDPSAPFVKVFADDR